jgi:translation elongation factor EF-Ts
MRNTVIIYDKTEFENTGDIIALKFSANDTSVFDKKDFIEFKDILFGRIFSDNLYNIDKVLQSRFNSELTILDRLNEINNILKKNIQLINIIRVNPGIKNDSIKTGIYNTQEKTAIILYIEGKNNEKTYSQEQVFITNLLNHIIKYRPLCLKEGDLVEEIKKKEEDRKGNSYLKFLNKAVLGEQKLEDKHFSNKIIKDYLNEFKFSIIDFNYIT